MTTEEVRNLAREVLIARKGDAYGFAPLLISCCDSKDELPATIVALLLELHHRLYPPAQAQEASAVVEAAEAVEEHRGAAAEQEQQ